MDPLKLRTGPISPIVITSKAARNEIMDIRRQHEEILMNMQMHQEKVANHKVKQTEIEKEKSLADTQNKKDAMDFEIKRAKI